MEYNEINTLFTQEDAPDLPAPYSDIAKEFGIQIALRLAVGYQGSYLYLPKLDDVLRKKRNLKIRAEFNGYNYRELANKYGVTDRWIRELVELGEDENQISMFD